LTLEEAFMWFVDDTINVHCRASAASARLDRYGGAKQGKPAIEFDRRSADSYGHTHRW